MPQLLLELLSEEIPARMQGQAARDLERLARERLTAAELPFERMRTFAGPRRLTLVVDGLPAAQPDRTEARKGPRTNAPDKALEGFLRSTGLTRDQLSERDGVYYASLHRPGRATAQIVAEMVEAIVRGFPWPKSMRWGAGALRWVRPLKRILCILDGVVVPFAIEGIESGAITEGHRFMGERREPFPVRTFDDYRDSLAFRFVVIDVAERKRLIITKARALCAERGLELVEDEGLLDEVAGLVEWPVPILGDMDAGFLDLPAEVIRTSMRTHQRYFAVRDPATGQLAPHFLVVANIEPQDGGAMVAAGNARVLTARLSDARFFWDEDRRPGAFDRWLEKLHGVTFHAKLGTMAERVERIAALAQEIAPLVGADPRLAGIAARLCKADLASGMVAEFPELQGIMGGYYVRLAGAAPADEIEFQADGNEDPFATVELLAPAIVAEEARNAETGADERASFPLEGKGGALLAGLARAEIDAVADAVRDHYKPVGPSDSVPTAPVTVAVALADKLDTLVGFFAIDERPTGSRDPFALRRAALGVIRLVLESRRKINVRYFCVEGALRIRRSDYLDVARDMDILVVFFEDRLKVLLRDQGKSQDVIEAAFATISTTEIFFDQLVNRVDVLDGFLSTDDGANLLAGYKRAVNILKAEAKKAPGEDYHLNADLGLMTLPQEEALASALRVVEGAVDAALAIEDFQAAMRHLSHLRAPVDDFFDKVLVNDADPAVRLNRLRVLADVRDTANRVADFSLVSG